MFTKTSLLLSLCASCAYAFTPPARIDVPCVLSHTGRPTLAVTMGTQGSGKIQNFNFTFTTSLGYTSVASKGCNNCSNTPLYDIGLSPQARSLNGTSAVSLGAGSMSGTLIKENCTLSAGQTSWAYTNQTIVLLDNESSTSPFSNSVSGLLGLGTLVNSTSSAGFAANFGDGLYGQYFIRTPEAENFTFGLALKPSPVIPGDSDSLTIPPNAPSLADAGTVHWLQPDTSAYDQDKVQRRTVQGGVASGYLSNNQQPDWTVQLDSWSAMIGTNNVRNGAPFLANVDPYYSGIYMPGSQARLIHDAIPGSQSVQKSTIPGQTSSWTVPCNTALSFTVNIGDQQFQIDQSLLVVNQGDGSCISVIEGFTDSSVTQYIFGQTWISQLYIIFNIPKNGDPELAFAPRAGSAQSRDIGAIVGGTVGGVAGVVAIGLVAYYFLRKRRDRWVIKKHDALGREAETAMKIEPYLASPDPAIAGYSSPSPHTAGARSPLAEPLLSMEDDHDHPPGYDESTANSPYVPQLQNSRDQKHRHLTSESAPFSPNDQTSLAGPSNVSGRH